MLAGIAAWLANVGIGTIANRLAAAYEAREKAKTDKQKIAADERIKALQARRDVLVAEAASRINSWMRSALALPVAIILWKVFVYDKALGQWTHGTTDALSPELWQVVTIVIGFYFLADVASTVTRIVKRKGGGRD
jgi:Holin of 3TMs, for gene-transfer release